MNSLPQQWDGTLPILYAVASRLSRNASSQLDRHCVAPLIKGYSSNVLRHFGTEREPDNGGATGGLVMAKFVMLTRVFRDQLETRNVLPDIEQVVMEHIRAQFPDVQWLASYAVLGPYDYMDLFEAPTLEAATWLSTLVRTYGYAQVEIWPVNERGQFRDMLNNLP